MIKKIIRRIGMCERLMRKVGLAARIVCQRLAVEREEHVSSIVRA